MDNEISFTELLPIPGRQARPLLDVADEPRPAIDGRPWVYSNMITSLDGGVAIEGLSAALGGPADQLVFGALRSVADVIIVGARTAIDEDYRAPTDRHRVPRIARGQAPRPTIAIVTRRLSIEPTHRVFSDRESRPIIITTASAPDDRRSALASVADIVVAGEHDVDLDDALRQLASNGHHAALLEGGPTLNGQFVDADLIDEWNVSLSPILAGGDSARAAHGPSVTPPRSMRLERLWMADGMLFGRWLRTDRSAA